MDSATANLLLGKEFQDLSPEVAYLYLLLRSDICLGVTEICQSQKTAGALVCGFEKEFLAEKLKCTAITLDRLLDELRKRRLIRLLEIDSIGVLQLGLIQSGEYKWFIEDRNYWTMGSKKSTVEIIKEMVAETRLARAERSRLSCQPRNMRVPEEIRDQIKEKLGIRKATNPNSIRAYFREKHINKWGIGPAKVEGIPEYQVAAKETGMVKHGLSVVGDNIEKFKLLLDFMFENWEAIQKFFDKPEYERPSWNMLASKKFLAVILAWQQRGVPERKESLYSDHGNRASDTSVSPNEGWGDAIS